LGAIQRKEGKCTRDKIWFIQKKICKGGIYFIHLFEKKEVFSVGKKFLGRVLYNYFLIIVLVMGDL